MSAAASPTPLQALSAFSAGVTFDALPPLVVESFTHRVLDTLGICIAATALDTSGMATRVAAAWGGPGEAAVVGHPDRLPAAAAGSGYPAPLFWSGSGNRPSNDYHLILCVFSFSLFLL